MEREEEKFVDAFSLKLAENGFANNKGFAFGVVTNPSLIIKEGREVLEKFWVIFSMGMEWI